MKLEVRHYELKLLVVIIVFVAGVLAWSQIDSTDMMSELNVIAEEKLVGYLGEADPKDYETLILVDGGKSFKLFGRAWGVIHIYIRNKGDEDMKTFKGLEYYFKRYEDRWHELDSAGCGALEHHVRAFKEFEARGMKVSPSVYARMNKK